MTMPNKFKKRKYEKRIIVFLFILIMSNIAHCKVLCFGADGHIEIESAFNSCCEDHEEHANFYVPTWDKYSSQAEDEESKRCGLCIDIPITNDLIQLSDTNQKWNHIFQIPAINEIKDIDKLNNSANNLISCFFNSTSYYMPLRTVILLV